MSQEETPKPQESQEPIASTSCGCEAGTPPESGANLNPVKHFTPYNLLSAFKHAFSLQKTLLVYLFSIGLYFWVFKFKPFYDGGVDNWYAHTAIDIAFYLVLCLFAIPVCAVAYIVKRDMVDDDYVSTGEAFKFVFRNIGTVLMSPLFYVVALFGFGLILFVGGAIGKIPYVGPIFYSFLLLPGIAVGFIVVLLGFLFIVAGFLAPGIIADKECGFFVVFAQTLRYLRERFLSLLMLMASIAVVTVLVFYFNLSVLAISHERVAEYIKQDSEFGYVIRSVPDTFKLDGIPGAVEIWQDLGTPTIKNPEIEKTGFHSFAAWVYGLNLFLLGMIAFSIAFNFFVSAGVITYLIVKDEEMDKGKLLTKSAMIFFAILVLMKFAHII